MLIFFLIFFVSIGLYCVVKGIRLKLRHNPDIDDYNEAGKKAWGYIIGGLLLIAIGIWKYYTRAVLWGW